MVVVKNELIFVKQSVWLIISVTYKFAKIITK